MNKAIIIGRMVRDPEMRTTQNGLANTTFTLAVNRPFSNQEGEKEADFINCVAWRKQAENIAKYCVKGSQVAVEGRIQTRSYDAQDGSKRYVTEVIVENCTFLSTSNKEKTEPTDSEIVHAVMNDNDPFKDFGNEVTLSDDDYPF